MVLIVSPPNETILQGTATNTPPSNTRTKDVRLPVFTDAILCAIRVGVESSGTAGKQIQGRGPSHTLASQ